MPEESQSLKQEQLLAELERIKAQLDAEKEIREGLTERLTHISEEIGEIRRSIIEEEKKISEIDVKATKAADLVKEVHPEELMAALQKDEAKIEALQDLINSQKLMVEKLMEELKEIKRTLTAFKGYDEVIKLYGDIKKDITTLEKLKARIERDADKVESIFLELSKKMKDTQALEDAIKSLEEKVSANTQELQRIVTVLELKADKADVMKLIDALASKPSLLAKLLHKQPQEVELDVEDLKRAIELNEGIEKKFENLFKELSDLKEKITYLDKKIEKLEKEKKTGSSSPTKNKAETPHELSEEEKAQISSLIEKQSLAIEMLRKEMDARFEALSKQSLNSPSLNNPYLYKLMFALIVFFTLGIIGNILFLLLK
ncbi:MAG: hypothetical protein GXN99_02135 [Candidatus Nanohaloarchaeota archaeon]|nr:hypothetical protein [Candidatus Nanohaloarchaeota archaeon]